MAGIIQQQLVKVVTAAKDYNDKSANRSKSTVVESLPNLDKLLSKEVSGSPDLSIKETDCPTFKGLPGGIYMDI